MAEQLAAVEPLVRGICRSRLGGADGDDAAQRTMVTLWRRLADAERDPVESLTTYAAVRARYEVLESLGQFARRPTVPIGEAAEWAVDHAPGPEAQAVRAAEVAEAAARVEALLAGLTSREVQVLRATKLAADEPDTATAARELGITPKGVRSAQVRAMARLREQCGTRSPNPLASGIPESERRASSWATWHARNAERVAQPSPAQAAFAADLRRRRLDRGLSQAQLAAELGCNHTYVSKVENGHTWPSAAFAGRLDAALDAGAALQRHHDDHAAITAGPDAANAPDAARAAVDPDPTANQDTTPAAPAASAVRVEGSGHLPSCLPDLDADATSAPGQPADRQPVEDTDTDEDAEQDTVRPSSAAAACAMAHLAVHAAVAPDLERDQAEEQARAEQLTRWHADDLAKAEDEDACEASDEITAAINETPTLSGALS